MRKYFFIVAALLSLIIGYLLLGLNYYFTCAMIFSFASWSYLAILDFKGELD